MPPKFPLRLKKDAKPDVSGASALDALSLVPDDNEPDDETIAVIMAAIAAYMAVVSPGAVYAVKKIIPRLKSERKARPLWAMAGMEQNVEPF